jgi:hypothetical protein
MAELGSPLRTEKLCSRLGSLVFGRVVAWQGMEIGQQEPGSLDCGTQSFLVGRDPDEQPVALVMATLFGESLSEFQLAAVGLAGKAAVRQAAESVTGSDLVR